MDLPMTLRKTPFSGHRVNLDGLSIWQISQFQASLLGGLQSPPAHARSSQGSLWFQPARLPESEQATPWRELQRSSRPAPCLQVGLPLNHPRQSPPRAGPFAPSAPEQPRKVLC